MGRENKVSFISCRPIFTSDGAITAEVELEVGGRIFFGKCPRGTSVSSHELRQSRETPRGLLEATRSCIEFSRFARGFCDNKTWELSALDNEIVTRWNGWDAPATSMSFALYRADFFLSGRESEDHTTPKLFFNLINSGKHAFPAQEGFQEIGITVDPEALGGVFQTVLLVKKIHSEIARRLSILGSFLGFGLEGGIVIKNPAVPEFPVKLVVEEAEKVLGGGFEIYIDAAAEGLYNDGTYHLCGEEMDAQAMFSLYRGLVKSYGLRYLEDGFSEKDSDFWVKLLDIGIKTVVDDPAASSFEKARKLLGESYSGAIIKPDQVGSVFRAEREAERFRRDGKFVVVSHRSGETCDRTIAELALSAKASIVKFGSPRGSERMSKYNELSRLLGV